MRFLVTGASGFIGRSICMQLLQLNHQVRAVTSSHSSELRLLASMPNAGQLDVFRVSRDAISPIDWGRACDEVDAVIHLGARAHVLREAAANAYAIYRKGNCDVTLALALAALESGVQRFIFISSVGVNGAETFDAPFTEVDSSAPHSPYAVSKYEAELGLMKLADQRGLDVVIVRPPLVYGPSAPGNFGSLMRAVRRGWPLPLGAVHNQRSLVALDNLVDFIITCITHPMAANQTFLVSDGQDLSTTELVRGMAQAAGVPARLLPVPVWALQAGASLLGKGDAVQRLCGNLQVDISKARNLLGWVPPVSVQEGLRRAMS
jgi:nucleoside-diphosphate-sugar epimerase